MPLLRGLIMPRDWDAQHREPPKVPRPELPSLAPIRDADHRLFLRFYLRSGNDKDQAIAKERCEAAGVDYQVARDEARRS